jgi:hypothetical protein
MRESVNLFLLGWHAAWLLLLVPLLAALYLAMKSRSQTTFGRSNQLGELLSRVQFPLSFSVSFKMPTSMEI